jgi:Ca-activated chloride channel family protein
MRYLSFFLAILVSQQILWSQIQPDKTSFDFGDIYAHSERFVDFYFKNEGAAKAFILRVEKQPNTVYQISSSTILPDSSAVIRIQIAEKKKGAFTIKIPVYLSDRNDAVVLKITGNIKELTQDLNSLTECPSFNRRPSDGNPTDFMLTVVTVDRETKKVLEKSKVEVIQQGRVIGDWRTDKEGKVQKKIPLGFTYFYASHEGYNPNELGAYVNFRRNYIVIELDREPEPEIMLVEEPVSVPKSPKESEEKPSSSPKQKPEPVEIEIEIVSNRPEKPTKAKDPKPMESETSKPTSPAVSEIPAQPATPQELIKSPYYVPSNIVFVLDVSWSMNKEERLELMKMALINLLEQVRPDDQITVVTYGNNAEVIIPTTKGSNREDIIERVTKIKGGGMTAGGKGIKLGYNMAIRNQIPEGNNQIFVITDGAFNKDSQDYERTITRNAEKGYVLSVVGIKNKPEDEEKMTEVATMGRGKFIAINSIGDARTKLYDEVKRASYREK